MREACADRTYFEVSSGGVTLSGGEPLLHVERALALLRGARAEGLHTCVQTCGAVPPATLLQVLPWVDLFQFDLKLVDEAKHRAWTGAGTARIHANGRLLVEREANVQFRLPVVPGITDGADELRRLAELLGGLGVARLRLVPYHRHYLSKHQALGVTPRLPDLAAPTVEGLARVQRELRWLGVEAVVEGDGA
jgi:pyruvate formate lyase activating enzyme